MKATKKAHQNFHEFLKDDKTFEKESKGLLIEIESKTSEKKVTYEAKSKLLKLINFLLSLDFLKNISSKIPNPKDYKSKEDFVRKSMEIIGKEFKEGTGNGH
ncbi:MAG: hypothetical protein IPO06_13920 [Leptospiraceae bacterium]|nr:hypothetical protein [Leptospiraceae bacterium]